MTAVIKISGKPIVEPDVSRRLWSDLARVAADTSMVIVHGGGVQVDALMQRVGEPVERRDGIRMTSQSQMPIVAGVLAGQVNQQIVAMLRREGAPAVGISLASADVAGTALDHTIGGRVGRVTGGSSRLIQTLTDAGYLPVVSSIGCDSDGELLNINADDAAAGVASGISATRLVMLTDVSGVLDAEGNLVDRIDAQTGERLIEARVISGGMTAKVRSAIGFANSTGIPVILASWHDAADVISGTLQAGTTVQPQNTVNPTNTRSGDLG